MELDNVTLRADTCLLRVGDRVLHDQGEDDGGFCAGAVTDIDNCGQVHVVFDGFQVKKVLSAKTPQTPTNVKCF